MKLEKIKTKIKKCCPNLTKDRENSRIKKVLMAFMVFLFVIYGGLFYACGRKMVMEAGNFNFPERPSIEEMHMRKMVKGRPISKMVPYIAKKNAKTANFLVAIAKKESNWGKYSPKKGKKECYNYWGYRGTYNQTSSGYSCFDSEKQAVEVVGKRIDELIRQGIDTPEKMVVWKCGNNCTEQFSQNEEKWIRDVGYYYEKMNKS